MHWFESTAPIRQKLYIAFGSLIAVMLAIAIVSLFAPLAVALPIDLVLIGGAAFQCVRYRKAIADPYVATVVRMEALAAGDVSSPIHFTDYKDCVGRLTRAMFTFRDTAINQKTQADEQNAVVAMLAERLSKLHEGDLTASISADVPPAFAELKANYNEALAALRTLIGTVVQSAAAIETGSGEIAQASEDLARRTEANAASLEETAAAITQMDQRLKATASAATQTVERADGAIGTVAAGRGIADEAVQAMTRVSESAKGIDSVIEGLDKIAFQTRVLAMNAAVEAGRAGEAGRGFAVVADLVSALAMRSEEEAARAREQLSTTQSDVMTAVEMVQKVDGALSDISNGVGEVHALLGQMASDNQAQSSAITQISVAIGTMDSSTQQNAAMVEQTSAAARNLTSEVSALSNQASHFRTGNEGLPARAAPRPRARAAAAPAYVSPVKALPMKAAAGADEWTSF